jgi:hypothetical protein
MAYAAAMIQQRAPGNSSSPQVETVSTQPRTSLSPQWAFVVQLRQGTPLTPEALTGRVEHIVTGQATLFASLDDLLSFMQQVLSQTINR